MIWMVGVADEEVEGVAAVLVETSLCEAVWADLGFGVACSAFAFFAGTPLETGSGACCTFLFAIVDVV
jgi:hypothetical protein